MKGYKAFNKDLMCRDMQYKIGETYELGETPICCKLGFHFCKSLADCYNYYEMSENTRICEVEALGKVVTDDELRYCTNKIKIIKEIKNPRKKSNVSKSSLGYCNSGNRNSGDRNSGNRNSGNWNSGNRNSGDCNSGNFNSGDWNSGDFNSGDCNSGNNNSGNFNSGNCNSGDYNSGDWNSGDWNSGNRNSGVFNTNERPTIKMFDKESNWTDSDWYESRAYRVMCNCPYTHSEVIGVSNMSEKEKENHPEHKTIGGYIKTIIVQAEEKQMWWDKLSKDDKLAVMELPNFDADKFFQCTEIRVNNEVEVKITDDEFETLTNALSYSEGEDELSKANYKLGYLTALMNNLIDRVEKEIENE